MEKNEPNMHAYTGVMMKKAHLDWEMECLQTKIKCKNEENSKLENQISERKNELEKLRKSVSASCEREEKVKNNITMLRNSRTISEGLLMSMKHQLRILEEKRNDTRNIRKNIIEKYTKLFESHTKIYSNLPWVKKINQLEMSVKSKQIHLDILKLKYSSIKRNLSLFHRIQDKRKVVAITRLAKCLVVRKNLQKEVQHLFNKQKEFQSKIIQLEEDKIKLQEKIHLKVKEALDEARGRVVKKHVGESIVEKHSVITAPPDVATSLGTSLKPTNESIFSRLGLSVPLSMTRLLTPTSRTLRSINDLMEEQSTTKDVSNTENINRVQEKSITLEAHKDKQITDERVRVLESAQALKEDHSKKKDALITEKINKAEEKSASDVKKDILMAGGKCLSASQALKRPSTSVSNISEKIPHLVGVTQKNKVPAAENVQASEDNGRSMTNNEKTEAMQPLTASEPPSANNLTIKTVETENKKNTSLIVKQNLKNKLKKDSNSESTLPVQVSENTKSYTPRDEQNEVVTEESLRDNENELISNSPEEQITSVNDSQEIQTENEIQPQKQVMRYTQPPEETAHEKSVINDADMNDSNLSMLDNISVVSSTFTNENRNQMAKSPDFLNQIPQGYCFSPLYSPSKMDNISEVSSIQGAKSPSNNFPMSTSVASPLFPIDAQPTAGPSSDFSSFFGTSPKKSENSSKNFFQLFG